MSKKSVIAIDGPAGAGKSSISKLVAAKLGFIYIDTGAMYRSIAWKALQLGIIENSNAIEELASKIKISFKSDGNMNRIFVDDTEVTDFIRTQDVSNKASFVSSLAGVRKAMLVQQRALGDVGKVIMDGRDVGTCIFPDACVKVFLTATSKERARRRYIELVAKDETVDIKELQKEIDERDKADSERAIAPLKKADDAIELETTKLSIKETVDKIVELARSKMPNAFL